jgi:hypothetical protein
MPGYPTSTSAKFLAGLFATPISAGAATTLKCYSSATTNAALIPKATTGSSVAFGDISTGNTPGTGGSANWVNPTGSGAAGDAATIDLYIGLIQGTATGSLTDASFNSPGVIQASGAGLAEANYSGYKRVRITGSPTFPIGNASYVDGFSAVSAGTAGVSSISIDVQLQFPPCSRNAGGATPNGNGTDPTGNTIVGFFISTNPKTQLNEAPTDGGTAGSGCDIIAYGGLSSSRSITANDTPVFTASAITITLD